MTREHLRTLIPDDADLPLYRNHSLPGTEEVIDTRITLSQRYLLADRDDLEAIPAAIRKIREHAAALADQND